MHQPASPFLVLIVLPVLNMATDITSTLTTHRTPIHQYSSRPINQNHSRAFLESPVIRLLLGECSLWLDRRLQTSTLCSTTGKQKVSLLRGLSDMFQNRKTFRSWSCQAHNFTSIPPKSEPALSGVCASSVRRVLARSVCIQALGLCDRRGLVHNLLILAECTMMLHNINSRSIKC